MKKLVALLASVFFVSSMAFADAPQKVGVVDMQKVVQQAPETRKFNADLEKNFKPRQENLMKLSKQLQQDKDKLTRDSAVMAEKDRQQLQNKIANAARELQDQAQKYQGELNAARSKDMQTLMGKVEQAVNSVAKNGAFDLIIEKQAVPYATNQADVTEQVIKALS